MIRRPPRSTLLPYPKLFRSCQVRVASKVLPQWPVTLVTVLRTVIVLLPLLSVALDTSNVQALPNRAVLLVLLLQFTTAAVVSTSVTCRLLRAVLPQASAASP